MAKTHVVNKSTPDLPGQELFNFDTAAASQKLRTQFANEIPPHAGPLLEPRRNQLLGVLAFNQDSTQNLLYIDSTGGGKTIFALALANHQLVKQTRTLFITATHTLTEQHLATLLKYFNFPPDSHGRFEGGSIEKRRRLYKDSSKQLLIGTQCVGEDLYNGELDASNIGLVILDEVQFLRGDHAYKRIVDFCREHNIPIVFMSATPRDTTERLIEFLEEFGISEDRVYVAESPEPWKYRPRHLTPFRPETIPSDRLIVVHSAALKASAFKTAQELHDLLPADINVVVREEGKDVERPAKEIIDKALSAGRLPPVGVGGQLVNIFQDKCTENLSGFGKLLSKASLLGLRCFHYSSLHLSGRGAFLDAGVDLVLKKLGGEKLGVFEEEVLADPAFNAAFLEHASGNAYGEIPEYSNFKKLWARFGGGLDYKGRPFEWCRQKIRAQLLRAYAVPEDPSQLWRCFGTDGPKERAAYEFIRLKLQNNPQGKILFFSGLSSTSTILALRAEARFAHGPCRDLVWNAWNYEVHSSPFIGSKGMTRKRQTQILEDFRARKIQFLFSTSALEIGQHIPDLDQVVILDEITSPERIAQREGRPGRIAKQDPNSPSGSIYYVIIPGTEDEMLYLVGRAKTKQMRRDLSAPSLRGEGIGWLFDPRRGEQ